MVEITSRDTLSAAVVKGALDEVVTKMNTARSNGMVFVIMEEATTDEPIGVNMQLITQMRQREDIDAFIG